MKKLIPGILLLIGSTAVIASVRYDYTGLPVGAHAIDLFSPADLVTGYFVLAEPKPSGNFSATDFLDYQVQVGSLSLRKAQGADAGAHLVFDEKSQLVSWSFVVGKYTAPAVDPSLIEVWSNSGDLSPAGDRITVYQGSRSQLGAVGLPGSWVLSSPVPEPNSGLSFVLGAVALGLCRARS